MDNQFLLKKKLHFGSIFIQHQSNTRSAIGKNIIKYVKSLECWYSFSKRISFDISEMCFGGASWWIFISVQKDV